MAQAPVTGFWANRRVMVTGCTGFLGAWLVAELIARGADVTGLVRDGVWRSPFYLEGIADQVDIVRGSVEDGVAVERAINEYETDTVFHLAAQTIVGTANRNPLSTFEANVKGTWVVMDACRRSPLVTRAVVASSDKAYGDQTHPPYAEDMPLRGRHPYDVSKSCADLIAAAYHHTYATPVCITRCGNLFGPGDLNFNRLVPGTIRSALLGERPVIRSDGSPVRDYVYVKDAVSAYLTLAEKMDDTALHGRAFNVGTGEPVSVLGLTRRLLAAAGRGDLEPLVQGTARGEILRQSLSTDAARDVLGWTPSAGLDVRLREAVDWYRAHPATFRPGSR